MLASVGFLLCGSLLSRWSVTASFFVALPLLAYITWLLSLNKAKGAGVSLDVFFGHMAYPVYLLHWVGNHVALAMAVLCGTSAELVVPDKHGLLQTTVMGFALIVTVTLLISAVIAWCFESPIDARRRKWSSQMFATFFGQGKSQPKEDHS